MTLSRRPLVRSGDSKLFVAARDQLTRIHSVLRDELNVLVAGNSGTGKTSLAAELGRSEEFFVYRVALTGVRDAADAAEAIAEAIAGPRAVRGPTNFERSTELFLGPVKSKPSPRHRVQTAVARLVAELDEDQAHRTDGRQIVVVVDSLPLNTIANLFTIHADDLAEPDCTWVVMTPDAGDATNESAVNPAPGFFDEVMVLGALTAEEVVQVIATRLNQDAAQILADLGGRVEALSAAGAVALARELAANRSGRGTSSTNLAETVSRRRRQAELGLAELGRPAAILASEMKARGPVSPSDPDLLSSMGWKRSRASEVMSAMERAGLATKTTEVGPQGGRPRSLYQLVDELR